MSRPKALPDDVRQLCIQLVRGYDRRVQNYHNQRQEIISGSSCRFQVIKDKDDPTDWKKNTYVYPPSAHNASRTAEDITQRLLGLEELPETKRMRAVEYAKMKIGLDLPNELRRKLTEAIWLNCKSGRRYPYRVLDVDGFSERGFYRRRDIFLMDVANNLDMM